MLRYGIDCSEHTCAEAGHILGVTRERVRQIQALAEGRLQYLLRNEAPPAWEPDNGEAVKDVETTNDTNTTNEQRRTARVSASVTGASD